MIRLISLMILLSFTISCKNQTHDLEEWQSLFNGKDLSGWQIKFANQELNFNYKNTFKVENKMIRIVYDEYKKFEKCS